LRRLARNDRGPCLHLLPTMARSRAPALYDSSPRFIGANSGDDTILRSSQGPAGLTVLPSREAIDWFVDRAEGDHRARDTCLGRLPAAGRAVRAAIPGRTLAAHRPAAHITTSGARMRRRST